MPRQKARRPSKKTVGARMRKLGAKFPKRTDYKYLYKQRGDLARKHTTVICYFIVYNPDKGHSMMLWNPHRRGKNWNAKDWNIWLREKGLDIFSSAVLTAINDKDPHSGGWHVREYLGFHGADYEPYGTPIPNKGR